MYSTYLTKNGSWSDNLCDKSEDLHKLIIITLMLTHLKSLIQKYVAFIFKWVSLNFLSIKYRPNINKYIQRYNGFGNDSSFKAGWLFSYRRRTKALATLLLIPLHFPSAVTLKRKSRPKVRWSTCLNNLLVINPASHENESQIICGRKYACSFLSAEKTTDYVCLIFMINHFYAEQ